MSVDAHSSDTFLLLLFKITPPQYPMPLKPTTVLLAMLLGLLLLRLLSLLLLLWWWRVA